MSDEVYTYEQVLANHRKMMEQACHCLCAVVHPNEKGICRSMQEEIVLVLIKEVQVPMCLTCAGARLRRLFPDTE